MRRAFAYAIQRASILDNAFLQLNPAFSPLLPRHRNNSNSSFPDFNPEIAKQLLHEALAELNLNLKTLPPLTITFLEKGISEHTAHCLQKQFKECLGIHCHSRPLPWNKVFSLMTQGDFEMGLINWKSLWFDDPLYTLSSFGSSHHQTNFAKWENLEFRRLIELSEEEINPFQRSLYLSKAEGILSAEMPIVPLFYQASQALVSKNLYLSPRNSSGTLHLSKCYRKES